MAMWAFSLGSTKRGWRGRATPVGASDTRLSEGAQQELGHPMLLGQRAQAKGLPGGGLARAPQAWPVAGVMVGREDWGLSTGC